MSQQYPTQKTCEWCKRQRKARCTETDIGVHYEYNRRIEEEKVKWLLNDCAYLCLKCRTALVYQVWQTISNVKAAREDNL